jgi:lysophospholipase L1-like esterase
VPQAGLHAASALVHELPRERRECLLYLPLLTGVERVEVGVAPGALLEPGTPPAAPPMCFYGTSIVQGCCASRAGIAYPSILARRLDIDALNLGFAGSARMEPPMAALLAELNPSAYVIDCLPNMREPLITQRLEPAIRGLRAAHPATPVLLVESITYQRAHLVASHRQRFEESNAALQGIWSRVRDEGDANVHLMPGTDLLGHDGEATLDGTHPSDLGFARIADAMEPVLRGLLRKSADGAVPAAARASPPRLA